MVFCSVAVSDILLSQSCAKILVGDPHQQIYAFRGARNALQEVNSTHTFYLTQVRFCMIKSKFYLSMALKDPESKNNKQQFFSFDNVYYSYITVPLLLSNKVSQRHDLFKWRLAHLSYMYLRRYTSGKNVARTTYALYSWGIMVLFKSCGAIPICSGR